MKKMVKVALLGAVALALLGCPATGDGGSTGGTGGGGD